MAVEVEPVEAGQEGDGADLLAGAEAGAADGLEIIGVALTKILAMLSTKIFKVEIGVEVARERMSFLRKGAVLARVASPSADLEPKVPEMNRV